MDVSHTALSTSREKSISSKANGCIRHWNNGEVNFHVRQSVFSYSAKTFVVFKQLIYYAGDWLSKASVALTHAQLYLGRAVIFPHFSTQNLLGPLLPRREANPSYGMLDVPVTNCTQSITRWDTQMVQDRNRSKCSCKSIRNWSGTSKKCYFSW